MDPRRPSRDGTLSGREGSEEALATSGSGTEVLGQSELTELVARVHAVTQVDLSRYRHTTVRRQILRRMQTTAQGDAAKYLQLLRDDPAEARALKESVLVAVTRFFRDAAVFERVGEWLAQRAAKKARGDSLRLWVPGCATGEEVYSYAIVLHEILGTRLQELDVHVFGTDADERAVREARAGRWARDAVAELSASLLSRYFFEDRGHLRIVRSVRDLCVFATHDLLRQPPFRNMDMVSCRNVLIYFQRGARQSALRKLHYALAPAGCLVLGTAESTDPQDELFSCIDRQHKLFEKVDRPTHLSDLIEPLPPGPRLDEVPPSDAERAPASLDGAVRDALAQAYVPPSVLVSEAGEVLHLSEGAQRYLRLPSGSGDLSIFALCLPELRGELRTLQHLLGTRDDPCLVAQPVTLAIQGSEVSVRIAARRLYGPAGALIGNLLTFEERPLAVPVAVPDAPPDASGELVELRQELSATREHLHALVGHLETANERLLLTNQELQRASEEAQSANEELQASNEELLSLNEDLQVKSQEIVRANDALHSIQSSIQVALVVVDGAAHVLSFNALAVRIFGLLPRDHGRSLTTVPCTLTLPDLPTLVRQVIASGEPSVHRIDEAGRHYLLQVSPYETSDGGRSGAVLAFTDVGELRRVEREAERLSEHFRATFEQATVGIAHVSLEGRWLRVNAHWCETLGYREDELQSMTMLQTIHPEDRALLEHHLTDHHAGSARPLECRYLHKHGSTVWVRFSSTLLSEHGGERTHRLCVLEDITASKEAEQKVLQREREFRQIVSSLPLLPWSARPDGSPEFIGEQYAQYTGYSFEEMQRISWDAYVHEADRERIAEAWTTMVRERREGSILVRLRRHDGVYRWFVIRARPVLDEHGHIVRWFGANSDVHEERMVREQLELTITQLGLSLAGARAAPWTLEFDVDADGHSVPREWTPPESVWQLLQPTLGPEHPVSERWRSAVHPDDVEPALAMIRAAFAKREPLEHAWRTHPASGPTCWRLARAQPIFDTESGTLLRYAGLMVDITAQKSAEEAQRATRRSLERASQIARVGHFIHDLRSHTAWNDELSASMLGIAPGCCDLTIIESSIAPDQREVWAQRLRRTFAEGRSDVDCEVCHLVNGAAKWLRVLGEVEYDAQGPTRMLGAYHDVTERRQAHLSLEARRDELEQLVSERTRALHQKERELQSILDAVPCAIGYWDASRQSRFANEAHLFWFGTSPRDMQGRTIEEVVGTRFGSDFEARVAAALAGEPQVFEREVQVSGQASSGRYVRIHLLPDRLEREPVGMLSLIFDISSLKRAEQLADAASRAKGQFLANMSHEIRTPLHAVLGLAELGERDSVQRATQERFASIRRAGKHLLSVIDDILDFSKIEAGKLDIRENPVDLAEIEAQAVTTLAALARKKGISLRIFEEPSLPRRIVSDSGRIAQILINLLSNAIKFTDHGFAEARLGYEAGALSLRVHDSGRGISNEAQQRLFTPFEQGLPRSADRVAGTGLGLAICKRLVTQMQGTLTIDSQLSVGTMIHVLLPCQALEPPDFTPLGVCALVGLDASEAEPLIEALHARGVAASLRSATDCFEPEPRSIVTVGAALPSFPRAATERWLSTRGRHLLVLEGEAQPNRGGDAGRLPKWLEPTLGFVHAPASPLTLLLAAEALGRQPRAPVQHATARPLEGVRVLAAEDNDMNRLLMHEILTGAGASLVCVENGAEVVERLERDGRAAFDVVLCDIEMPVLDGYEATRRMRRIAPDLPIIGLSAHAFGLAVEQGREAGMVDYVTKPYSVHTLVDAILRNRRPLR